MKGDAKQPPDRNAYNHRLRGPRQCALIRAPEHTTRRQLLRTICSTCWAKNRSISNFHQTAEPKKLMDEGNKISTTEPRGSAR